MIRLAGRECGQLGLGPRHVIDQGLRFGNPFNYVRKKARRARASLGERLIPMMSAKARAYREVIAALAFVALAFLGDIRPTSAQDDARTRQLRLLCARLSGDLTEPGGIAAFRRCLTSRDPLGEVRRDNNVGGGAAPAVADRPDAKPPKGFGGDSRRSLAQGVQRFVTRDGKLFYAIDKDNRLWLWNPASKDSHMVEEKVADIGNSLGSQTGYATRMSAKMRVGLVVKV
jgi:hypothetical protein